MLLRVIINIIASLLLTLLLSKYIEPMAHADILSIAGVLSTVAGILFGFVLASISIFGSASSATDGLIHALKKNNVLPKIIRNLLATGATLILACIFPLVSMFLSDKVLIGALRVDYSLTLFGFAVLMVSILSFIGTWRKINWILPLM